MHISHRPDTLGRMRDLVDLANAIGREAASGVQSHFCRQRDE
jgi:hypothetical protein